MDVKKEPARYLGVENRVQFIALGIAIALTLLVAQFWRLQVVNQLEYREKAEKNQVWQKNLPSDRGIIYGRDGIVLADNHASVDVVFVPGECPEEERAQVCAKLEHLLNVDGAAIVKQVTSYRRAPYTQLLVKEDVTKSERTRVEEFSYALPGVIIVVKPQRRYQYGTVGGQLMGYVGSISPKELERWRDEGYDQNDIVGKTGIERMYEKTLRGYDGYAVVTKYAQGAPQLRTSRRGTPVVAARDSHGHLLEEISGKRKDPVSGDPVYLTLDVGLQAYCEELLAGEVGAIVVLDAKDGAVLALASTPSQFDPSIFVTPARSHERMALLTAPKPNPMFNRAYRENYAPGSIFKVMMATAALEEQVVTRDTTFYCPGYFQINGKGRKFHCHQRTGHGNVSVLEAIAWSCDVYFYNVALKLGVEKIAEYAKMMGMGDETGIDLPGEVSGLIPTEAWKKALNADKEIWEQNWYPGETAILGIGQGSASTTPLQNAVLMATILNGGECVRPYVNTAAGPANTPLNLRPGVIEMVVEGMRLCMEDNRRGTGRRAQIPGMVLLGKTGTAQMVNLSHHAEYATEEDIPYDLRDHAWFICGVVDREPQLAISVLVEHGAHGSTMAAPMAKALIEYYYNRSSSAPLAVPARPLTLARQEGG